MHQFIQKIQDNPAHKLRKRVQQDTAKAIEALINEADEIPGVGKLISSINVINGEVTIEMALKRPPASSTLEHTQG